MTNHLLDGLTTKTVALIIAFMTVISVNTSQAETRDIDVVVPSEQQALDEFNVPVSDLKVEAWVDRPDGLYKPGDTLTLYVKTNEDAYITVVDQGTSGKIHVIFPNKFQRENHALAYRVVQIPARDAQFRLRVGGPAGTELIKIIATTRPTALIPDERLAKSGPFYRYGGTGESLTRDLNVEMKPQASGASNYMSAVTKVRIQIAEREAGLKPSGSSQTSQSAQPSTRTPEEMFQLGESAFYGDRDAPAYALALKWFQRAADKGHNRAMFRIGWLYEHGQGVRKDFAKARAWYRKAANLGNSLAMVRLARMYVKALGVTKNFVKARNWLERAATAGDSEAMANLAILHDRGLGATVDPAKAAEMALEAIRHGHWRVQERLGDFSAATRREVQHRLRRGGYYRGNVDGVIGPETHAALVNYARAS